MEPTFGVALFALLPLGLFSLLNWRDGRKAVAGFAWIAALAPLVISGVKALAGAKSASNKRKAEEANARMATEQAEAQRRQEFESQQSSPQAQMSALQYKLRLGKLAGKMGGLNKVPPSILKALQAGYQPKQFQAGPAYQAPKTGRSAWDYVDTAADVASTVDWGSMKNALGSKSFDGQQAGADAIAAGGGINKGFQAPAPISNSLQQFQQSSQSQGLYGDRFKKKPGDVF